MRRRPVPQALQDEPDLFPGLEMYQAGFWKLNTTRQCGMSIGPIPDNEIEDLMDRWEITAWEDRFVFEKLINVQDLAYLEHKKQEATPKEKKPKKPIGGVKAVLKKLRGE